MEVELSLIKSHLTQFLTVETYSLTLQVHMDQVKAGLSRKAGEFWTFGTKGLQQGAICPSSGTPQPHPLAILSVSVCKVQSWQQFSVPARRM